MLFKKYNRLLFFSKKRFFYNIMIENSRPREENIIKDIDFQINYTAIKDIRNLFKREKETKAIKNRILRDIKNIFEHEEENYYKSVRVNNFWSKN